MDRYVGNDIFNAPEGYYWLEYQGYEIVQLRRRGKHQRTVRAFGEMHGRSAYGFSQEFILVGPIEPPVAVVDPAKHTTGSAVAAQLNRYLKNKGERSE